MIFSRGVLRPWTRVPPLTENCFHPPKQLVVNKYLLSLVIIIPWRILVPPCWGPIKSWVADPSVKLAYFNTPWWSYTYKLFSSGASYIFIFPPGLTTPKSLMSLFFFRRNEKKESLNIPVRGWVPIENFSRCPLSSPVIRKLFSLVTVIEWIWQFFMFPKSLMIFWLFIQICFKVPCVLLITF